MSNDSSWIMTFTGQRFDPFNPKPTDVRILDIAHSLAMQCRFTGHTTFFYSVAQHSVLVCDLLPPQFKLWGLLHDASEAYLVDLASPIKHHPAMEIYRQTESAVMAAICSHFDLPHIMPSVVKTADEAMLWAEAKALMPAGVVSTKSWAGPNLAIPIIDSWPWQKAETAFLDTFFGVFNGSKS